MYKSPLIFIIILIVSLRSVSQQNSLWYFGNNAAVSFNAGPGLPHPLLLETVQW
jgi:hypothetical protein